MGALAWDGLSLGSVVSLGKLGVHLLLFVEELGQWVEEGGWHELAEGSDDQGGGSDGDAGTPLTSGDGSGLREGWKVGADEDLGRENSGDDSEEVGVVEEALEHVEIALTNLSAVDLVEDLQEDEGVEDVSVVEDVVHVSCWVHSGDVLSEEDEHRHDDDVPGGEAEDLSPKGAGQDRNVCLEWLALNNEWKGWLSGKTDGSEGVHDQVDPKELDWGEWRLTES